MLKENKIQAGQDIFDLSNIWLGGFDNIMTLISLNPQFESIDVDLNARASENFKYDTDNYQQRTYQLQLAVPVAENTISSIVGKANQSLEDLCLMAYGSLDFFSKFISDNDFNLNDPDIVLKTATFDKSFIVDGSLMPILTKKGYILAGGLITEKDESYRITENDITRETDNLIIRLVD